MKPTDLEPGVCAPTIFKEVFLQFAPDIRNFMYAKCGDTARAEDLTQEAFVRLWKNCAKVLKEKSRSFLFTVANNLFLDAVRHDKIVLTHRQNIHAGNSQEDPQYLLEVEEFKEKLEQTLAEMPEASRVAFMLNRFDGLTYQEIADQLGISKKAVEKRMSKALIEMRKLDIGKKM